MTRHVDLRSDTVTQPTRAMREAMASAVVGDDGFGDDPTVHALEQRFAEMVGKEAAVFVPSGVMANQIAVRILTRPGDVIIAGKGQHVVSFEMGASARNASVQFALVDDARGELNVDEVMDIVDAEQDHQVAVSMVALENTHMSAGGAPWDLEHLNALARALGDKPIHMDGARLFNASIATGESPRDIAACSTTVMACLSKGLCAPVGSLLAGPAGLMTDARVERKRLGGAMRQVGILAAAGLVALESMVERLAEDHVRARKLGELVASAFPESEYDPTRCRTNIVAFDHPQARQIVFELTQRGVWCGTIAPRRVRFVTHAGVSDDDIDFVGEVLTHFTPAS
ncbi:MAG: aminotransferase class I/II-fold pyridoxal phosphate-dependent enzyme [Acidimicrobiaceae bacterium]|nr:aminotransferase class I/II-fold pyridoxal phosphate-dependent enzyme [Acidimicrobiaceae bacterium]